MSRTVPMRVLALSLPETGTTRVKMALEQLGYGRIHDPTSMTMEQIEGWKKIVRMKHTGQNADWREVFDELLGDCMAVTDMPCAMFWPELLLAYPEAKVIVVERDIDDWTLSFEQNVMQVLYCKDSGLIGSCIESLIGSRLRGVYRMVLEGYFEAASPAGIRDNARDRCRKHYEQIREAVPKGRLLHMSLEEGWGPLCGFLDKEVPKAGFPEGDETFDLGRELKAHGVKAAKRRGWWVATKGVGVVGAAYMVYSWYAWYA